MLLNCPLITEQNLIYFENTDQKISQVMHNKNEVLTQYFQN
jgi:hypothetical protein